MIPELPAHIKAPQIDTGMLHEPGIYFGMPDDEYHAIPAFSTSGTKELLVSPMDFWTQSWMNPQRVDKDTQAKIEGRAYHARILEGKEVFFLRYVESFDESLHPNALDTVDDIKKELKSLGQKVTGKKDELIERLLDADPSYQIMDHLCAEYARKNPGKIMISKSLIANIEKSAFMIERDPAAINCFRGGYPEVVIIWIDPITKVPMKAKLDYLKIKAICDLKTFSNPQRKHIDAAIGAAVGGRRYHLQVANYLEADEHARRFAATGRVFGDVDPDWLKAYAEYREPCAFFFVFQQSGDSPITRVKEFSRVLETYKAATGAVRQARATFAEYWRIYGTDPWLDLKPIEQFSDCDFPLYIMEA
ncbi:hypothetical protein MICA_587 [Micavibrio aeruginosavorus ARL-13]|uniref:SAP domain-containing protein n=2 Tax=Micavibrio aeruginosavorus TaxID=349221 RepID=G2KMZ2_MICAA|nr:hypothetical protein MICA_587 [Micavibrio aeruginosavorus ARL-13]